MLNRPLASVFIALSTGITVAYAGIPFCCLMLIVIIAISAIWLSKIEMQTGILLMLVFLLGMIRAHSFIEPSDADISKWLQMKPPMFQGTVATEPETREYGTYYTLSVSRVLVAGVWRSCEGLVWINHYNKNIEVPRFGQRLLVRATLRRPQGLHNPDDYSWEEHLSRQHIFSTASIGPYSYIKSLGISHKNPIRTLSGSVGKSIADSVSALFAKQPAALITGMTLGSYSTLPEDLQKDFSATGTLHLLAASGFNCGVLILVFGTILRLSGANKRLRHPVLIAVLLVYLFMVGFKASIIRATIVAVLGLLAISFKRPPDPLNLLYAAAVTILFIFPHALWDIGFQLSFAAAFGIVVVAPLLNRIGKSTTSLKKVKKSPLSRLGANIYSHIWQVMTATLAATLMTAPVTAQAFNQVSLIALPANIAAAALSVPLFASGLASPVAVHIPVLNDIVSYTGNGFSKACTDSIHYLASCNYSCLYVPSPGLISLIGYYLIVGAALKYVDALSKKS